MPGVRTQLQWTSSYPSWGHRRKIYHSGDYEIVWVGSTHGIWDLRYQGTHLRACARLSTAKFEADMHHKQQSQEARG